MSDNHNGHTINVHDDNHSEETDMLPLVFDSDDASDTEDSSQFPRRLRRAEAILAHRTQRIVLVLEQMIDSLNHQAVLRTCEALGVQYVYCVDNGVRKTYLMKGGIKFAHPVTQGTTNWLTVRLFHSTEECIEALRADNRTIWATFLGTGAKTLDRQSFPHGLPERLAVVIGREVDGVSPQMLHAADERIFLPQYGYCESFNVSVASALVVQRLFDMCPECRGDLDETEKRTIRRKWYRQLAPIAAMRDEWEAKAAIVEANPIETTFDDIRPMEESREPRLPKKLRKKMEAAGGHRPVLMNKDGRLAALHESNSHPQGVSLADG